MGYVLWIQPEGEKSDKLPDDFWALLHFADALDRLCTAKKVRPWSEFHDGSEAAAEFDIEVEPSYWEPDEVLATLAALETAIREENVLFADDSSDRTQDVLDEIREARREIEVCKIAGRRVNLAMVG